jgi:hypothetical protein
LIPDFWQSRLLSSTRKRIAVLASRQSGKSTVCAALALRTAFTPRTTTILIAPVLRQSALLMDKVRQLYRDASQPVSLAGPRDNVLRLQLANQSKIVALPGDSVDTVRGYTPDCVVVDEAAFVKDGLMTSVLPMLAVSNGQLVCVTSAFAKRGFFYSEWVSDNDWERYLVPAAACPRIKATYLDEMKKKLGPRQYAAEFDCLFGELSASVFRVADIEAAVSDQVTPLFEEE